MTERNEEWGPWIDHDGKGCPCKGMFVKAEAIANRLGDTKIHGPFCAIGRESWTWATTGLPSNKVQRIIRYRIRRPRALQQLREMIRNLPVEVDA